MDVPAVFPVFDVRGLWPASLEALDAFLAQVPQGQWRTWLAAPGASWLPIPV